MSHTRQDLGTDCCQDRFESRSRLGPGNYFRPHIRGPWQLHNSRRRALYLTLPWCQEEGNRARRKRLIPGTHAVPGDMGTLELNCHRPFLDLLGLRLMRSETRIPYSLRDLNGEFPCDPRFFSGLRKSVQQPAIISS